MKIAFCGTRLMTDEQPIADKAMESLRRKYSERLRERGAQIYELANLACQRPLTSEERFALQNHAHSLAGSGATYGYPEISEDGRALEKSIEEGASASDFVPLVERLFSTFNTILLDQVPVPKDEDESISNNMGQRKRSEKCLLVIDDDLSVHEMIGELFRNDINLLSARDGGEGLRLIRSHEPDLVLLDGTMPGMKGMTLLETLHQDEKLRKTNVVMLTANNQNSYMGKAIMAGALGYITKPFDPPVFAARIRSLFARLDTTILIVDDDPSIQDLLWHKFHAAGLNILQASDGDTAMTLAIEQKPKLAIIDWMMPGLDGLALLRMLKKNPETRDMKIVMLTVKHQEQDILEGLKLGAEDYITKPFITEEVAIRCFRLLGLVTHGET
jgi:DNA-binding response OmpR family regulator